MSDDLRDRLAAVLYGSLRRQQRIDRPDRFLDWIDTSELADAVIAELGLNDLNLDCECCDGSGCECCDEGTCQFKPLSVEKFLGKDDHTFITWKDPRA